MGIVELRDKVASELIKLGLEPVALTAGGADMPGDYLVFASQVRRELPKPNLAQFSLFVVRSDLEGNGGAYESLDKLMRVDDAPGIAISGAALYSYKGGLYTYKADIQVVWPKNQN
jgi:hypothetical protein